MQARSEQLTVIFPQQFIVFQCVLELIKEYTDDFSTNALILLKVNVEGYLQRHNNKSVPRYPFLRMTNFISPFQKDQSINLI